MSALVDATVHVDPCESMCAAILMIASLVLTACGGAPAASGGGDLTSAAKAEGQLTVIALPHDWCNYGEAISGFNAKYGIKMNELLPDGGSGDEIEAIKANKDSAVERMHRIKALGHDTKKILLDGNIGQLMEPAELPPMHEPRKEPPAWAESRVWSQTVFHRRG